MSLPEGFGAARRIGPFAAVADKVERFNVGRGEVLQVVQGDQPGLLLTWQDPMTDADFDMSAVVALDRPDVAITVRSEVAWLLFPSQLVTDPDPVVLRVWNVPPHAVPPAWERAGREERVLLASFTGQTVLASTTHEIVGYDESKPWVPYRTVGQSWLQRFGSVQGMARVLPQGSPTLSQVGLALEVEDFEGGTPFTAPTNALNHSAWESVSTAHEARHFHFPCPCGPFRLLLYNLHGIDVVLDIHVWLSTSQASTTGRV